MELEEVTTSEEQVQEETSTVEAITVEDIRKASNILRDYKAGKSHLEARIIENEEFWKLRHWRAKGGSENETDPEPASAWLLNSVANKHADYMDNYPEPNILPREQSDKEDAKILSNIMPVVLENANYRKTYSDASWYKLVKGTSVYGVFWNNTLSNGLGDIDIKQIDLLNLFWEPGIKDIQRSRNLFNVELVDDDILEEQYPQTKGKLGSNSLSLAQYINDETIKTDGKSAVIDWYYKKNIDGRIVTHLVRYVNDVILYASENEDEEKRAKVEAEGNEYNAEGFYSHGKYPFVFDKMYPEEGMPTGFGVVDQMKDTQMYIDKLQQVVLKNSLMGARPRFWVKDSAGINEEEFADWTKEIVHCSKIDDDVIKQMNFTPLNSIVISVLNNKIEELKETSGNTDFSQGGTASGVTAASAIAALQEAGSKLSRDSIQSTYRAFEEVCYICLELIRQFYDEPRSFRIVGEKGAEKYIQYQNNKIKPQFQGTFGEVYLGYRLPIFDIKIIASKASAFSKISQNELAKELYGMGFFKPDMADQALAVIDMMDFESKSVVEQKIGENGTMYKQMMQMQEQMQQMAGVIANLTGDSGMMQAVAGAGQALEPGLTGKVTAKNIVSDPLGAAVDRTNNTTAATAKEKALSIATPK